MNAGLIRAWPLIALALRTPSTRCRRFQGASEGIDTYTDGSDTSVTVPDVVGMNLQSAQERLRALGLGTSSSDATGQGRMQLWDRNWEVVGQSPAAGTEVSIGTSVDMSVKKIGE